LPPGTVVRQLLVGKNQSQFGLALLDHIPYLWILFLPITIPRYFTTRIRLVAVADDAIYVVQFSRVAGITWKWRAKRVVAVVPRATRLGPPVGLETRIVLGDAKLFVITRSHRDEILAADAWSLPPQVGGWAQSPQATAAPSPAPSQFMPVSGTAAPLGYPPSAAVPAGSYSPAGQEVTPSYALQSPYGAYGVPYAPVFAGFWIRLVAYVIDAIVISLLSITIIGIVVAIPYMPVMWWKKGATLGQRAMGLKVVRAVDGGPVAGWQAFVGFIVLILESIGSFILIGLLGFVWAAFEGRKRAWHDIAAGTVVIHVS
jgi:uncharacterized RDD family membrane protein YckC